MFDEFDEDGILIQRYGPHSFHTNDEEVYNYVSKYAEWSPYRLTYRAIVKNMQVPCPFNFTSIRMLYEPKAAETLIGRLKEAFPDQKQVAIFELLESKDDIIREYAEMLFEEDFRPYTAKQWGRRPEDIDQSIIRRVPVLLSERDSYFDDAHECHPNGGYTAMFRRLLDHPLIKIKMGIDALSLIEFDDKSGRVSFKGNPDVHLIYTGAIDELFECRFGSLPYRSLHFEWEKHHQDSFQETAIVAYPKDADFTRITEFTKLPIQFTPGKTVIAKEYPLAYDKNASKGNEPYYPIGGPNNHELRDQYLALAAKYSNLTTCGRLADYKYYNMEDVVRRALEVFNDLKAKL
jgi:UDP-galactopyranose mutase